jgi:class 3 adenylate cyclase
MNNNDLARIDRYTCKFENPVMEDRFMAEKWKRVKRPISFAIIFFTIIFIFDAYNVYNMIGEFKLFLLGYPVFILLYLSWFKFPERLKRKKFDIIFACLFMSYHFFQIAQMVAFPDTLAEGGFNPNDMLAFLPTLFLFIYILFPGNFVTSVIMTIIFLLTFIPLLMQVKGVHISVWIFSLPVPLILLTYNKYNSEHRNRSDFAKSVSIDETKNLMQTTLKRYFGDVLSDKMLKEGGELDGENKWVSILFSDLSSYSTITENMSPEVALEFLNEYFTAMHEVIKEFNGHILNYIGDSIMVVFGAPEKLKNHENQAVKCSLKMKEKLKELNHKWDEDETSRYWKNHDIESITMRIGIHTGSVIAGNLGSQEMLQYSTIGDTVNVSARLEQANKDFNTEISFSHEIYTALTKELYDQSSLSGEIILKGRNAPTKVYSI